MKTGFLRRPKVSTFGSFLVELNLLTHKEIENNIARLSNSIKQYHIVRYPVGSLCTNSRRSAAVWYLGRYLNKIGRVAARIMPNPMKHDTHVKPIV